MSDNPPLVHSGAHQTKPPCEGVSTPIGAGSRDDDGAAGASGAPLVRTKLHHAPPSPAVPDLFEDARAHERERCRAALKAQGWLRPEHLRDALAAVDSVLPGGRSWPLRPEHIADPTVPEVDKLRALVELMAETVTELEDWLGHASTRQAADDALHRMGRALTAYYGSDGVYRSAHPLQWRGLTWEAMDRAGIGWGEDDELRVRLPDDKRSSHATGPLVSEALRRDPPGCIPCGKPVVPTCDACSTRMRESSAELEQALGLQASGINYRIERREGGWRVEVIAPTVGASAPTREGALAYLRDRFLVTAERLAADMKETP